NGLHRIQLRSLLRRIQRCERGDEHTRYQYGNHVQRLQCYGQVLDEVHGGVQLDEPAFTHYPGSDQAEHEPKACSNHTDHQALSQQHAADPWRRHAHRLENSNLSRLVGNYHRQGAHDVERRHDDDKPQNHSHSKLLEPQGLKEVLVLLLPVHGAEMERQYGIDGRRHHARLLTSRGSYFQTGYRGPQTGKLLAQIEVHIRVLVVIFVHPCLESTLHLQPPNARDWLAGYRTDARAAECRDVHAVSEVNGQPLGQRAAEHDTVSLTVAASESEVALLLERSNLSHRRLD